MTEPCDKCGTWKCAVCDGQRKNANRAYPWGHRCPKCGSGKGAMAPVRHRSPQNCRGYNGERP